MKPVIVATNFSQASVNAANYAAGIAATLHTDIILLHVIEIPVTAFEVPITEVEFKEAEDGVRAGLEDLKKNLMAQTKNKINISTAIKYGFTEDEIGKFSYEKKPLAVVVGIKSAGNAERFILGSTVHGIIHHIYYPVLIIPENVSFNGITNIAIASDLKDAEENTSLLFVKQWLHAFHASPDFVHVNTGKKNEPGIAAGIKTLQNSFAEFSPRFHFADEAKIKEGINNFIKQHKTDLLIVIPEQYGMLESLFKKSDSMQIILHSHLAVLSVMAGKLPHLKEKDQHVSVHSCKVCDGSCADKKELKKNADATSPSA